LERLKRVFKDGKPIASSRKGGGDAGENKNVKYCWRLMTWARLNDTDEEN